MEEHIYSLVLPRTYAGLKNTLATLRRSRDSQECIKILKVEVFFGGTLRGIKTDRRIRAILELAIRRAHNLEEAHVKIRHSTRISTLSAETVAAILEPLGRNRLIELCIEGAIFVGNFDGCLDTLRNQRALTTLHLELCSPLPENYQALLPALFRAVSEIPLLKEFHYSSIFTNLPVEHGPLISPLTGLATKPTLEVLDLRSLGVPEENSQLIAPVLENIHSQSSLRQLTLGNLGTTPMEDFKLFSAAAGMLTSIQGLKKLELYAGANTDIVEASKPILDSLKNNRTLQSLSFMRILWDAPPLIIPENFGKALEKDNLTLETLDIYNTSSLNVEVQELVSLRAKIEFYLKLNRGGRRRLLEERFECDQSWMEMLWKFRDDVDVLYYYLKLNPDLMGSKRMQLREVKETLGQPPAKRQKTDCTYY